MKNNNIYKIKIKKVARKWATAIVKGKYSTYDVQILVSELAEIGAKEVGLELSVFATFKDLSDRFSKKYQLDGLKIASSEEIEENKKEKKELENKKEIAKYWDYVLEAFEKGYIYKNGVAKLQELGATQELEKVKEMEKKLKEEKEIEKKQEETKKAKEATEYCNIPSAERFSVGEIFIKNSNVYQVQKCTYEKYDGWSFGVCSEHWYNLRCTDISNTEKGKEFVAETAKKEEEEKQEIEIEKEEKTIRENLIEKIKKHGAKEKMSFDDIKDFTAIYDTLNVYGGGDAIYKKDDTYIYILNNGRDGDNWELNNFHTGGAGAIAWVVWELII